MGEMKEGDAAVIFPPVEVVGADHGGGARPAGGLCALLQCGRRKEAIGWGVWAKRPDGPADRWADWAEICRRRFRRNFDMRIFPKIV
jgi:hypothetical protein